MLAIWPSPSTRPRLYERRGGDVGRLLSLWIFASLDGDCSGHSHKVALTGLKAGRLKAATSSGGRIPAMRPGTYQGWLSGKVNAQPVS